MNPSDLVTFVNADTQPFQVIYNKMSYGIIQPGAQKTYPRYLYEHALKHLLDQILNRENVATNNSSRRAFWTSKILVSEQPIVEPTPLTREEMDFQNIQREESALAANPRPANPLDRVVSTHARAGADVEASGILPELDENGLEVGSAPTALVAEPTQTLTPTTPSAEDLQAQIAALQAQLQVAQVSAEPAQTEQSDQVATTTETIPVDQERDQVLSWAKNNMAINVDDPKTKVAFEAMSLPDLKQAVQYEG